MRKITVGLFILALSISGIACSVGAEFEDAVAWTGGSIWTGTDGFIENGVLIVREGRILDVFSLNDQDLPTGITEIKVPGKYIIPGLINAHGHVGMARGLQTGSQVHSRDNVKDQLGLYARYGVTTVVSLGDEPPQAFEVRDDMDRDNPGMARLFMSGPVLNPGSPESARDQVENLSQNEPDWVKIRVDDQLGRSDKMPAHVYGAIIEAAHDHGLPLASHMVTLEDARELLRKGADLMAHSVRDQPVDQEMINLMLERDVCITPTLTREISVFVYAERPDFFDDPFFLKEADEEVLEMLQSPEVQQRYRGAAADYYREALPLAKKNMMELYKSGIRIAMGTDSGPPARFQGYFEHMEMEMMQNAGMTPVEVLQSATVFAAACMGLGEELGTLESGKYADFLVIGANPMDDIRNLRQVEQVYVAGKEIK